MTLTELKAKHEAENTYFGIGPSRWDGVPVYDGILDIEYTYDDWLNDQNNNVFKNLIKPYGIDRWGNIPTELSFYVKYKNPDFDPNIYIAPLLKIDCRVTLTKEVNAQIEARQKQYIDQQAERVFTLLKEDYEFKKPKKEWCIDFIRHWFFENRFVHDTKPDLLFAKSNNVILSGPDEYTEANFDTIKEAYKKMHPYIGVREPSINCKWVVPNFLDDDIRNEAQIVTLAYIQFLGYLESLVEANATIPSKQEKLYQAIISACQALQGSDSYWNEKEDKKNSQIRDLLNAAGYVVCDQSKHGESSTGKSSGELDGLIKHKDNLDRPFSIFEGVNLKTGKIKEHIKKLEYNYDTWGLDYKYLLVYKDADTPTTNKFDETWLDKHSFHYSKIGTVATILVENNNLKVYKTTHNNDSRSVYLYYVVVEIRSKST